MVLYGPCCNGDTGSWDLSFHRMCLSYRCGIHALTPSPLSVVTFNVSFVLWSPIYRKQWGRWHTVLDVSHIYFPLVIGWLLLSLPLVAVLCKLIF
jgi:hypothetical protein